MDGYFTLLIGKHDSEGTVHPDPANSALSEKLPLPGALWMTFSVNGATELKPRQALASVPYAMSAHSFTSGRVEGDLSVSGSLNVSGDLAVGGRLLLGQKLLRSVEDVTFYVDDDGSDETGNGTEENPWRTIQRAVDSLPSILDHSASVFIKSGTYAENVVISGLSGAGSLLILGDDESQQKPVITSPQGASGDVFYISNCTALVTIRGMKVLGTGVSATTEGVLVYRAHAYVSQVEFEGFPSGTNAIGVYFSFMQVHSSVFKNNSVALGASSSIVRVFETSGTGDDTDIHASWAAVVSIMSSFEESKLYCASAPGTILRNSVRVCPI